MYIDIYLFWAFYYLIGLVTVILDSWLERKSSIEWSGFLVCLLWPFVSVVILYHGLRDRLLINK